MKGCVFPTDCISALEHSCKSLSFLDHNTAQPAMSQQRHAHHPLYTLNIAFIYVHVDYFDMFIAEFMSPRFRVVY